MDSRIKLIGAILGRVDTLEELDNEAKRILNDIFEKIVIT